LSPEERAGLQNSQAGRLQKSPLELRQQVGLVKSVSYQVDFRGFRAGELPATPTPAAKGALASHPSGVTWTAAIDAGDATALRLYFTAFKLPPNAKLYIYNDDGQVDGPYTDSGNKGNGSFWSHTIAGGSAYVQVEFDGQPSEDDLRGAHFVIADVAYIGPSFQAIALWGTCRSNASCVKRDDPETYTNSAVHVARQAVAHMQFVSLGRVYICSGGLLADTDTSTERNYFLTANHCISDSDEAGSLETFFLYTECGTGLGPAATAGVGAQFLAGGSNSDFTLLELDGTVPGEAMRLGWNSNAVSSTNGLNLYRISHPNGAPQSYSEHTVNTGGPTCSSWPRGPRIYSEDIVGATEGGSSGSPVLDGAGDVVGQLSGACGYNPSDSCDRTNATVDGALAAYFPLVEQWLAPEQVAGGNTPPVASFGYSCNAKHCEFTDQSTDADGDEDIVKWSWDFGDSTYSPERYPDFHLYENQGNYTVTLTVTDFPNETSAISATFRVKNRGSVSGSVSASDGGGGDPVDTIEAERGRKKCGDGIDNDGDGFIDGADPDCQ
jgi:hypothetical protein